MRKLPSPYYERMVIVNVPFISFRCWYRSIRAVLFDLHGNQIAVSQKEWIHKSDPRYPGSMNFDVIEN